MGDRVESAPAYEAPALHVLGDVADLTRTSYFDNDDAVVCSLNGQDGVPVCHVEP